MMAYNMHDGVKAEFLESFLTLTKSVMLTKSKLNFGH